MKKNMANTDRIIRVIVAVIFASLYFTGAIPGTLGIILLIVGIVFMLTAFISFCPIYAMFGLSTLKKKDKIA